MTSVQVRREGRAGWIVLDRPRALNALDLEMIEAIAAALDIWRNDPAIELVVIEGAGGRAFCAGADIRAVRELALAGKHGEIGRVFAAEYSLNGMIAEYPKPYVALIDGICMGGGMGVSMHGRARVATARADFAMPETGIGFFPDVGASWVLPRLPGHFGTYMALTGARIGVALAHRTGLVTHFAGESLGDLPKTLRERGLNALDALGGIPPDDEAASILDAIEYCFSPPGLVGILHRLEQQTTPWGRETLALLRSRSPDAVAWTFELMRLGAGRDLRSCLRAELALACRVTQHPDFAEGVRAMLVDKDRQPKWARARIEDVDPAETAAVLA